MNEVFYLILLTLTPFLESRASIPYGILVLKMPVWFVFAVAIGINILMGFFWYYIYDKVIHLLRYVKPLEKLYQKYVERTQKKIHPYVEKYGEWGLIAFIGVPLPGSGVISGSLAGYLLGMSKKHVHLGIIFGAIIAGLLVTAITLSGSGLFSFLLKV